ncbi:ATP-binding protein [Kribbella sindirgiensis]|uniref:HTH luxR-type domain-containing protein n=1 Tax=Kribbella sindirgiensis TaxID=1124744 RepID=A0A4V2M485_9ACTN|nr:AAA family ATPase [Kribbella sindirgiensis]TCC34902.1 hypothetical protein E0H50_13495 [Kribbella sindirgiensis]
MSGARRAKSVLVERDGVLEGLVSAAKRLRAGGSSVVMMSGEAGIGKTTVINAFVERLDTDFRLLRGNCDDLLAPTALGPLREAFRDSDDGVRAPIDVGDLGSVLPAIVADLSGKRATVLILEDMHWADDASIDVVRYLVRRLTQLNVLLVITVRSDSLAARRPLRALQAALNGAFVQRVVLGPLSPAGVRVLAEGSGRDPEYLHRLSAGNPFYLTELLEAPGDGGTPLTVVDAVVGRAMALDPADRAAVEQLSIVPWPVDLDFAERLLGEGFKGLATAETNGLLELSSGTVRFRHEIARRAIEETIPQIRRIAMHRAVVTTLLARVEVDSAAVVHHAVEGFDVATILRFAPSAARQAARAGSHRQALICFEAVVPFADGLEASERAQLLDDYAWELHIAHRFDDAVRAAGRAVGVRQEVGDVVPWIETMLRLARHRYMAGDTAGAITTIECAEQLARPSDSAEARAATMTYRGMILVQTGLLDAAIALLPRARDAAVQAGRPELVSLCSNYLGVALTDAGDARGLACLRDALASALEGGHDEAAARAYTNLAEILFRHGLIDDLGSVLEAGARFTQERGFWSHAFGLEVHEAQCSLRRGDWDDAERRLQSLEDSAPDPGMLAVYHQPMAARLRLRHGDLVEAHDLARASWHQAWIQQSVVGILYGGVAYAEWAWVAGRGDIAQEIHDRLAQYDVPAGLLESFGQIYRLLALAGADVKASESIGSPPIAIRDPYERAAGLASSGSVGDALQAISILDALGAVAPADDLRGQLRRLRIAGIPSGPVSRVGGGRLTRRQAEVLRLLGAGLTNAEIAARLVVSVRTVDHHVSAILGRLAAGTRREAVGQAVALGLLAAPVDEKSG